MGKMQKYLAEGLGTFTLVALRLLVGAALLWTVVRIARMARSASSRSVPSMRLAS